MAKNENDGYFADEKHEQEFGPVCRYKDGESHTCTTVEELTDYDKDGWKDTPQPKPVSDQPKPVAEVKKDEPTTGTPKTGKKVK